MPFDDASLIEKLNRLPDVEPPRGLVTRVMEQLPDSPQKSGFEWFFNFIFRPVQLRLKPVYGLLAILAIALVGWAGWHYKQLPSNWSQETVQAEFQYVTGRSHLSRNDSALAVSHLSRAVQMSPQNADYHFWLGVAHWANGNSHLEARQYERTIQLNPDYTPARLYLAHNQLDNGNPKRAIQLYGQILNKHPQHSMATYNLAVAFQQQGHLHQAIDFWERYLEISPSGPKATQVVAALHRNGVYHYQLVPMGEQLTAIRQITFPQDSIDLTPQTQNVLQQIGNKLSTRPRLGLHIVVFNKNSTLLAKKRANVLKQYLLHQFTQIPSDQIMLSWFGRSYTARLGAQEIKFSTMVRLFGIGPQKQGLNL